MLSPQSCDTRSPWLAGHSLGGALATLAAHSFASRALQEGATPAVTCYTFGSPRAGNHAFAAEYNQLVQDTWHIINDQVWAYVIGWKRARCVVSMAACGEDGSRHKDAACWGEHAGSGLHPPSWVMRVTYCCSRMRLRRPELAVTGLIRSCLHAWDRPDY